MINKYQRRLIWFTFKKKKKKKGSGIKSKAYNATYYQSDNELHKLIIREEDQRSIILLWIIFGELILLIHN